MLKPPPPPPAKKLDVYIKEIETEYATVFLAFCPDKRFMDGSIEEIFEINPKIFFYGGTRIILDETAKKEDAIKDTIQLVTGESTAKHALWNSLYDTKALDKFNLPEGIKERIFAGGRCVVLPKDKDTRYILSDLGHEEFDNRSAKVFEGVAAIVNKLEGRFWFTPDFDGRLKGFANKIYKMTPYVLGIDCEYGGCGGKSSYTVSGTVASIEASVGGRKELINIIKEKNVVVIGSNGSVGKGIVEYLTDVLHIPDENIGVSDLSYDNGLANAPDGMVHLPSVEGKFTKEALNFANGGLIITATLRNELQQSSYNILHDGTIVAFSQNLAIPFGKEGILFVRELHKKGILVIPGPLMTLTGAGASRFEAAWRAKYGEKDFTPLKDLVHDVAQYSAKLLINNIFSFAERSRLTPYEALYHFAGMKQLIEGYDAINIEIEKV